MCSWPLRHETCAARVLKMSRLGGRPPAPPWLRSPVCPCRWIRRTGKGYWRQLGSPHILDFYPTLGTALSKGKGARMRQYDEDGDGQVSAEELANAKGQILMEDGDRPFVTVVEVQARFS